MYTRPLYATGNSLPATNVLGFRHDTKRLRGRYLADCSPFHRKHPNLKPDTSHPKPAPAFIDDGD